MDKLKSTGFPLKDRKYFVVFVTSAFFFLAQKVEDFPSSEQSLMGCNYPPDNPLFLLGIRTLRRAIVLGLYHFSPRSEHPLIIED